MILFAFIRNVQKHAALNGRLIYCRTDRLIYHGTHHAGLQTFRLRCTAKKQLFNKHETGTFFMTHSVNPGAMTLFVTYTWHTSCAIATNVMYIRGIHPVRVNEIEYKK